MTDRSDELDIYYWRYDNVPIQELKNWIEEQIKAGRDTINLEVDLKEPVGIENIKLIAKK